MSELPIVQEITALPSHADRADWMMRCPDWSMVGFVGSIRRALELANFPEAVLYLDARTACLQAVRTREGHIPNQMLTPLYIREAEMREAARRRDRGPRNDEIISSRAGLSATPREGARAAQRKDGE